MIQEPDKQLQKCNETQLLVYQQTGIAIPTNDIFKALYTPLKTIHLSVKGLQSALKRLQVKPGKKRKIVKRKK